MKGRPVDQMVFEQMFAPKGPRHSDPQNFASLLQRHLILEVRQEVHAFYGHLDTQEAKYPGLDYTHPTHRIRLSRWPWHRRLFRTFDALGLTPAEIANLTKWEGTKWAKERYEREQGITIRDTTADGFPAWSDLEDRPSTVTAGVGGARAARAARATTTTTTTTTTAIATTMTTAPITAAVARRAVGSGSRRQGATGEARSVMAQAAAAAAVVSSPSADSHMDEDSDEGDLQSVGVALNERLRARVALRDASGDTTVPLDEEWELWLKNAIENGELPDVTDEIASGGGAAYWFNFDDLWPPSAVEAARAGRWHEFSPFVRDMIRSGVRHTQREYLLERQYRLDREHGQARETSRTGDNSNSTNGGSDSTRGVSTRHTQTGTQAHTETDTAAAVAAAQTGASTESSNHLPSIEYVRAMARNGGSVRMIAEYITNQDRMRRGVATQADIRVQQMARPAGAEATRDTRPSWQGVS